RAICDSLMTMGRFRMAGLLWCRLESNPRRFRLLDQFEISAVKLRADRTVQSKGSHLDRSRSMPSLRRLNYQHLLYFWSIARTGSLTRACEELALSPPT